MEATEKAGQDVCPHTGRSFFLETGWVAGRTRATIGWLDSSHPQQQRSVPLLTALGPSAAKFHSPASCMGSQLPGDSLQMFLTDTTLHL